MISGPVPEPSAIDRIRLLGRQTQADIVLFSRANFDVVLPFPRRTLLGCANIVIPVDELRKGKASLRIRLGSVRMIARRGWHRHTSTHG